MQSGRRDIHAVAVIFVTLAGGLAASWMRWGNPLVDCGREMNQPLRLAGGEMLYSQVRHIYGPLSPYLNAALFKILGPSLGVLYAEGILCAILILIMAYWLSRQLMGRIASIAATLSVMWLCAFKPAGNYILPYSYGALHGCFLGLVTLVATVLFIRRAKSWLVVVAGVACGLTILAKTEMGAAAMIAGLAGSILVGLPDRARAMKIAGLFVVPAILIAVGAYSWIALQTGWDVLANDSFLLLRHLPPELVYFNKRMSGLDHPLLSLMEIGEAALRYAALAVIIVTISRIINISTIRLTAARGPKRSQAEISGAGHASVAQILMLLAISLLVLIGSMLAGSTPPDTGPFMAMPILLGYLLVVSGNRYLKASAPSEGTRILIVMSIYAMASLARIIMRVRSGGAYSSYMIPVSIILLTYCLVETLPAFLSDERARLIARRLTLGVLLVWLVLTGILSSYRYRIRDTYAINSPRGKILTQPDLGVAFDEAIQFINTRSQRGDPVAVLPEGTSLDFLTDRRNPLREEIVTPGFLDRAGEQRAIAQLKEANTRLILVTNRPTPEFGLTYFGSDYCRDLAAWIDANYELAAVFGLNHDPTQQVGDKTFFIKAYLPRFPKTRRLP